MANIYPLILKGLKDKSMLTKRAIFGSIKVVINIPHYGKNYFNSLSKV